MLACGGGGGGSTPPPAPTLKFTEPTSGPYQLKRNAASTGNKLVLDVMAVNAGTGAGVAFILQADPAKVSWAKVQANDPEYVRNGTIFTLGNAPQALKSKVSGGTLQVVISEKGYASPKPLNGHLATVALELKSGIASGPVTLSVTPGKASALTDTGAISPITIATGTLTVQ